MALEQLNRPDLDSQILKQLETGTPDLRFNPFLEKEYQDFCHMQKVSRGRLAASVAFLFALAVSSLEIVLRGTIVDHIPSLLPVAVLAPLFGLILLATYMPALDRHYELIAATGITLAGVCGIYVTQIASLNGASYLLASVVLINLYACRFLGLRFGLGVSLAAFLVLAHIVIGLIVGLPMSELLYMTAILGAATVIGTVSSYNWERTMRKAFIEQRMLNELAQRDGLTGLYNRRIFDDYIQRVWRQARRDQVSVEIIFIDIDHFKNYNDLHGHQAGDDCLRKVAVAIARAAKRPFDFSARYGGEEFVLVLYGPPDDYARTLPEQLRQEIIELAIRHEVSHVAPTITVSVGVALADPSSGRSLTGAIQAADEALYEAKQRGRNRVIFKDASESEVETGNFRTVVRQTI
ncbi:MAG TPA: diguanylate cyclase [Gammaproteobacteria bacterium]|nr:diguanylate cyclase [Gammaproteobacteria bacterium]